MVYRMRKVEQQLFLSSLNRALSGDQKKQLVTRIDDLCVALLRRGDSLIGGGMMEYRDLPSKLDSMMELFNSVSIKERLKFDEEGPISPISGSTPVTTSIETMTISPPSTSLLVLTFVLLSVGPVLRNRGMNVASIRPSILQRINPMSLLASKTMAPHEAVRRKNLLQFQHLEQFLYSLPLYLRSLDKLQDQYERDEDAGRNTGSQEKPRYDINVVWTPNGAEEVLSESDLLTKWPSAQVF